LVYLDQDVIKQLKKAALDEERTAYELTEEAVRRWLASREARRRRKGQVKEKTQHSTAHALAISATRRRR
jgi:hypothetical protein